MRAHTGLKKKKKCPYLPYIYTRDLWHYYKAGDQACSVELLDNLRFILNRRKKDIRRRTCCFYRFYWLVVKINGQLQLPSTAAIAVICVCTCSVFIILTVHFSLESRTLDWGTIFWPKRSRSNFSSQPVIRYLCRYLWHDDVNCGNANLNDDVIVSVVIAI